MWLDYRHRQEISLSSIFQTASGGPSNLLFNEYQWGVSMGVSGQDVKLMSYLHLVPRLRMGGSTPPLSLHDMHRVNVTFCKIK